jgi:redox-sensitive bicupin YhaK (pirin superfamily)
MRTIKAGQLWYRPNQLLGPPHQHEEFRIVTIRDGCVTTRDDCGRTRVWSQRQFRDWIRIYGRLAMEVAP